MYVFSVKTAWAENWNLSKCSFTDKNLFHITSYLLYSGRMNVHTIFPVCIGLPFTVDMKWYEIKFYHFILKVLSSELSS